LIEVKYIFFKGAVLSKIAEMSEPIPKNYVCLLKNLLEIEAKIKQKEGILILTGKYQPFRKECIGGDVNKLLGNLYANFGKSLRLSKKTKMYFDTPKSGFITKVYPKEKDMILTSYRPAEKKTKYYKKLIKFVDTNPKNNKRSRKKNSKIYKKLSNLKNKRQRLRESKKIRQKEVYQDNGVNDVLSDDDFNIRNEDNSNSDEPLFQFPDIVQIFREKENKKTRKSRKRQKEIDIEISNSISKF